MNFNTFLLRFGLNPEDFVDKPVDPIPFDGGFIYELEQRDEQRICPNCGSVNCYIKEYKYVVVRNNETINKKEIIKIRKIRYACRDCGKTFTKPLKGIQKYNKISDQTKRAILAELFEPVSFSSVSKNMALL